MGKMTVFDRDYPDGETLRACYAKYHPDAWWVPGNKAGVHDVSLLRGIERVMSSRPEPTVRMGEI